MSKEQISSAKKRKLDEAELEIDVNAPEPPSKKALRKAKKSKASSESEPKADGPADEPNLKRLSGLEGERSKFGIWIGNLAFATTKKDLYKFLITNPEVPLQPEQITRIHLPSNENGRDQNKGFAHVDLASQDLVETALQLSESALHGRRILIKDAKNFGGRPETTKPKNKTPSRPPNRRIFVGNLNYDTSVEMIEKHFGVCGPIQRTQLAAFEDSGRCKGYGWIEFESLSSAQTAMRGWTEISQPGKKTKGESDGIKKIWLHRLGERKLRMEYAEDATTRYNKRYGKNAKSNSSQHEQTDSLDEATGENSSPHTHAKEGDENKSKKRKPDKSSDSRYDAQTVQKLTGAIVEGQGSKVQFD
jgi:RNA recognition motif-containing protein